MAVCVSSSRQVAGTGRQRALSGRFAAGDRKRLCERMRIETWDAKLNDCAVLQTLGRGQGRQTESQGREE